MSGREAPCCLSAEDQDAIDALVTLHEAAKKWNREEFNPMLPEFLERASEFFALVSHDCRMCLVNGMQSYYQTHTNNQMQEYTGALSRAARRGNIRVAVPRTHAKFKHYCAALLDVVPSLAMRMETKRVGT